MNHRMSTSATREGRQRSQRGVAVSPDKINEAGPSRTHAPSARAEVALLTGGGDKPYALGLASTLISQGVPFDFIGSDEVDAPELHNSPLARFLNLRGDVRPSASIARKVLRVLTYYGRLLRYATVATPKVFHVLWNNKLEFLDRTFVLLFYRLLGKRIAFTVHNVNAGQRDGNDNLVNRLTLRIQYRLVDHLFAHTEEMKRALRKDFGVPACRISVIPFGINSTVPNTVLTSSEARKRLGLTAHQKVVLFFGNIAPYKGLEYLVAAMAQLGSTKTDYRLVIVGRPESGCPYWKAIRQQISSAGVRPMVIERSEYVPDAETEIYFKSADVLALPYKYIFQSGVLFLAYNFGLPVIASDVGSLREHIVSGRTGYVCEPENPVDLARAIETYFASELYRQLEARRQDIQRFASERYSWRKVGEITRSVYKNLLDRDNISGRRNRT
jgi:glycosyltransferase involved in cell wall biosynthesis